MKNSFFLLVVIFFCFIPFVRTEVMDVPKDAHDIHLVIETSRTYMDHTIKYTEEYWLADDKIYQKRNHRIFITRDDLGLVWSIDTKEKTYSERKIEIQSGLEQEPEDKSDQQEVQKEDIHNLGFHYEPDYDWEIKETDEVKEINGFPCHFRYRIRYA